jgi:hypothetical protein
MLVLETDDPSKAKLVVQGSVGQSIAMFKKSASSAGISIAADWPEIYFNSYYNGGVKAMKAGYGGLIVLTLFREESISAQAMQVHQQMTAH